MLHYKMQRRGLPIGTGVKPRIFSTLFCGYCGFVLVLQRPLFNCDWHSIALRPSETMSALLNSRNPFPDLSKLFHLSPPQLNSCHLFPALLNSSQRLSPLPTSSQLFSTLLTTCQLFSTFADSSKLFSPLYTEMLYTGKLLQTEAFTQSKL